MTRLNLLLILVLMSLGPVVALATAPADGSFGGAAEIQAPDLKDLAWRLSVEAGIDPRLVDALIKVESGYNPRAISRKGAIGMMQLMPATSQRLEIRNPFDAEQNIRGGVRELSRLLQRYTGNVSLALAAYNAGEGAVSKYGGVPPYGETRRYVRKIMYLYTGRRYGGEPRAHIRVRMERDSATGSVIISNTPHGLSTAKGIELQSAGALGGGFGR